MLNPASERCIISPSQSGKGLFDLFSNGYLIASGVTLKQALLLRSESA